jgi:hypothetical protein
VENGLFDAAEAADRQAAYLHEVARLVRWQSANLAVTDSVRGEARNITDR